MSETKPLLVYTYGEKSWERRKVGFQQLNVMAQSNRQQQRSDRGLKLVSTAVLSALISVAALAQQAPIGVGAIPNQNAPMNAAESGAFFAATRIPDPGARASAIQQFLVQYPNSPMRQTAIAQLMAAKRQSQSPGAPPAAVANPPAMNSPMPHPAPSAPMQAPMAAQPAPVSQATTPRDSLLQHAPKPPVIDLSGNKLTITADNSTLSQILHDLSSSTGMKVDGLAKDQRIFGTYGPGDSRQVLLSLLAGSGYNVLMLGDLNGAPRQLSLSERAASTTVASAANQNSNVNTPQDDDDVEQEVQQAPPEPQQPPNESGPGVVPAQQRDMTQDMQRLRQQQMQQQQQIEQQQQQQQPQ